MATPRLGAWTAKLAPEQQSPEQRGEPYTWRLRDWELGRHSWPLSSKAQSNGVNLKRGDSEIGSSDGKAGPRAAKRRVTMMIHTESGTPRLGARTATVMIRTERRHVCITGESSPGWYTVRTLTCFVSHLGYTNNTPPWPFGKPSGCLGISKELWVCYANPLFNGKFVNTNTS